MGFTAEPYADAESEFDAVFTSSEGRFLGEVEGRDSRAINIEALMTELRTVDKADDRCHGCRWTDGLERYPFGLARVIGKERDWTEATVSAALSAITLPLLGFGRLSGPATKTTAYVFRLELVLCRACQEKRKGLFGRVRLKSADYALHPWWKKVRQFGFEKLLDAEALSQYGPA